MEKLKNLKAEKRLKAGLPSQDEDTLEITRTMRASSPPASASDLLETQNPKRNARPFRRVCYIVYIISYFYSTSTIKFLTFHLPIIVLVLNLSLLDFFRLIC